MIQRFADWLVYDIFGLDASTALGKAINFFFYDTIKILILLFFIVSDCSTTSCVFDFLLRCTQL